LFKKFSLNSRILKIYFNLRNSQNATTENFYLIPSIREGNKTILSSVKKKKDGFLIGELLTAYYL